VQHTSAQKFFVGIKAHLEKNHKDLDDSEPEYLKDVKGLCNALQEAADHAVGGPGTAKKSALAVMTSLAVRSKRCYVHVPTDNRQLRHTISLHVFFVICMG